MVIHNFSRVIYFIEAVCAKVEEAQRQKVEATTVLLVSSHEL